jgi:hypothetical protein
MAEIEDVGTFGDIFAPALGISPKLEEHLSLGCRIIHMGSHIKIIPSYSRKPSERRHMEVLEKSKM